MSLGQLLEVAREEVERNKRVEINAKPKRSYRELKDMKFADDPQFQINDDDSSLLKVLKNILIEHGYTYADFLGQEKIIYSTFYNMINSKKLNFEIFEKFMRVAGLEWEIKVTPNE